MKTPLLTGFTLRSLIRLILFRFQGVIQILISMMFESMILRFNNILDSKAKHSGDVFTDVRSVQMIGFYWSETRSLKAFARLYSMSESE